MKQMSFGDVELPENVSGPAVQQLINLSRFRHIRRRGQQAEY